MRSNRHKTSYYEQKVQSRDRQITQLGTVLERQRVAIRELLGPDKRCQVGKQKEDKQVSSNNNDMQPKLYERIYTQIIEIGNRVLPPFKKEQRSYPSNPPPEEKPVENALVSQQENQKQPVDKQFEYLKSSEYRQYLDKITAATEGTDELLKKMKATRNNQAYLNHNGSKSSRPSVTARSDKMQTQRQMREEAQKFIREEKIEYNRDIAVINDNRRMTPRIRKEQKQIKKDDTLNLDMKTLQRELERLSIPRDQPTRKLTYTPTMKQLHAAPKIIITPTKKQPELKKSTNQQMRLQSKTIELTLQSKPKKTSKPKKISQDIEEIQQRHYIKPQQKPKQLKSWELDYVTRSVQKLTKKKKEIPPESVQPFILKDYNKYPLKTTKKKIQSEQVKYCKKNRIQTAKPSPYNCIITHKLNSSFDSQESKDCHRNGEKQNCYGIDFKLERPTASVRESTAHYPVPKKKKICPQKEQIKIKQYIRTPIFIVDDTKGLQNSESTSTLSQQKPLTPMKSNNNKYQSKLTVVTPSRTARR